jgi:hypothetical protein
MGGVGSTEQRLSGTARYLARRHAVEVTGLDLTAEYVHVAASLTRRAGSRNSCSSARAARPTYRFPMLV